MNGIATQSLIAGRPRPTSSCFDDYPSPVELSRPAGRSPAGDGYTLVAGRLADLYSTLVQCGFKTFKSFKSIPDSSQR